MKYSRFSDQIYLNSVKATEYAWTYPCAILSLVELWLHTNCDRDIECFLPANNFWFEK